MDALKLFTEMLFANLPGLLGGGLCLYIMEKTSKFDEKAKAGDVAGGVYGGARLIAWAIIIGSMLK